MHAIKLSFAQHFSAGALPFRAKPGYTWDRYIRSPIKGLLAFLQWVTVGSGPLSSLATQVGVFVRSDDERSVHTGLTADSLRRYTRHLPVAYRMDRTCL